MTTTSPKEGPAFLVKQVTIKAVIADLDNPATTLGGASEHHVVADIGASNCRIALVAKGARGIHDILYVNYPANSVPALREAFASYVEALGPERLAKVTAASVNGPAPASGLVIGPLANYKGPERLIDFSTMPAELFPRGNTIALNDLEACAHGIVAVSAYRRFGCVFQPLWLAHPGTAAPYDGTLGDGNCVVLAPGTGLGVAAIQFHAHQRRYTVLPLEFGHTSVVANAPNDAFLAFASTRLYQGKYPAEYDDLVSGRGMELAYEFLTQQKLPAGGISAKAKAGDAQALAAMDLYHTNCMRLCSQLAMGLQPRTIVLCGDNTVKNGFYYTDKEGQAGAGAGGALVGPAAGRVQAMHSQFLDHSIERLGFMSKVHVLRQVSKINLNLLGCAFVCDTIKLKKKTLAPEAAGQPAAVLSKL